MSKVSARILGQRPKTSLARIVSISWEMCNIESDSGSHFVTVSSPYVDRAVVVLGSEGCSGQRWRKPRADSTRRRVLHRGGRVSGHKRSPTKETTCR